MLRFGESIKFLSHPDIDYQLLIKFCPVNFGQLSQISLISLSLQSVLKLTTENNSIVNTLSYRTESAKTHEVERKWFVIDAENQTLGRMSSQIAKILQGKHKTSYTTHVDTGDHVIVINAEKVVFTGNKMNEKVYIRHTEHPGGQRFMTPKEALAKKPGFIIENAVKHMLPRTKLGRAMYKKLHVYVGAEHPHAAQQPEKLILK
jgi:large subunit ribosomal protein L13